MIYFGKDVAEYPEWIGGERAITFHSQYIARDAKCFRSVGNYKNLTCVIDADLYGVNDVMAPNYIGAQHHIEHFAMLAKAAFYIYVWSIPPSYTLSLIEAMIVGLPIVAPSVDSVARLPPREGSGWVLARYEVPELLSDGYELLYNRIE